MNKSNNFGLKNNESGPIHDYQISLNELQLRLTRTENRERNFKNITPNLKYNIESHKIILARSNQQRLANNAKRLCITKEVFMLKIINNNFQI